MRRFVFAILVVAAVAVSAFAVLNRPGAEASPDTTITVNSQGDDNTRDNVLTLREAMMLATSDLSLGDLDQGECGQVSGTIWIPFPISSCASSDPPGAAYADTIVFDTSVFPPDSVNTIWLGSALRTLDTGNDTVDGSSTWDGSKNWVIVQGETSFDCFDVTSDINTIKGLTITNCKTGVYVHGDAQGNTIGGSAPGERNVISGNSDAGVHISAGANGNFVQGNYIGTNVAGDDAPPRR